MSQQLLGAYLLLNMIELQIVCERKNLFRLDNLFTYIHILEVAVVVVVEYKRRLSQSRRHLKFRIHNE